MQTPLLKRRRKDATRTVSSGKLPALQDILPALRSVYGKYCLFLALDATCIDDDQIRRCAKTLLQSGLASLCVWGRDCERVHDLFDLEWPLEEFRERVVMTTWHSGESLAEALWFFEECAMPAESFVPDCTDWVALAVANDLWAQQIRTLLIENH